jgi:REP element-mobilizing transposase RayT
MVTIRRRYPSLAFRVGVPDTWTHTHTNPKRQRVMRERADDMGSSRPHEPPLPEPLAYFLTWSTYGTWLPGDERGWVEYRRGWQLPDPIHKLESQARMTEDACSLDMEQRELVEQTITDHCRIRGWQLHAVNCRTNHLHVAVSANRDPDEVRLQCKASCTRRLKELDAKRLGSKRAGTTVPAVRRNWWAERGSRRFVNDEASLQRVVSYICDGQDRLC